MPQEVLIFKFLSDSFTVSVLFVLAVYHLMIYYGRKSYQNENYNLYFSLFSFSLSVYLLTRPVIFWGLAGIRPVDVRLIAVIESFCALGMFHGLAHFIPPLVNFPKKKKNKLKYLYIPAILALSLSFTIFPLGIDAYTKHVFMIVVALFGGSGLILVLSYAVWIVKHKYYQRKEIKIIIIGSLILVMNIFLFKLILSINDNIFIAETNILIGIAVFLFAYALAIRFNNEYKELNILKTQLEQKVKKRTIELEQANKKIAHVSEQRTAFFINIAHETRTPLTLISNYLEKYIKIYGEDKQLSIIKQNVDKLKRDMVNFLDAEKLQRGQTVYNHQQITGIDELCRKILPLFVEYAKKKDIVLQFDTDTGLYVQADSSAIQRIVNNLIDNAVKFTPPFGHICFSLKKDNNQVLLKVKDTGKGIPDEKIQRIFEPYHQITHLKSNTEGIGMGLFIVKNILDQINGSIEIESCIGEGTTFTVSLPLSEASKSKVSSVEDNQFSQHKNFTKKITSPLNEPGRAHLFLVEDNISMLNFLIEELNENYNISFAVNGRQALQKLSAAHKQIDLFISDIMMDEMSGVDFFKHLQSKNQYKHVPFIFLTARSSHFEKVKLISDGSLDYISKPFSIDELKAKISTLISYKRIQRSVNIKEAISTLENLLQDTEKSNYDDKQRRFEINCNTYGITKREKQVILQVIRGLEYKEIASNLNISEKTVVRHVQNVYKKIKVNNKIDLLNAIFS